MIHDENGEALETAGNLKARFEMLQMQDTTPPPVRTKKFVPKRFKVIFVDTKKMLHIIKVWYFITYEILLRVFLIFSEHCLLQEVTPNIAAYSTDSREFG